MDLHSVAINGVVSAADAARLGIGPYELRRLCALGLLPDLGHLTGLRDAGSL